jgi:hypothetical protein
MENFNLKYKLLNYYFHSRKDLMGKNHNSRYIEKFGLQNPLQIFSLVPILSHHIIIEFLFNKFYSIKNII